jgi:hypothetical protein
MKGYFQVPALEQLEKRFLNLLAKKTNFMVQRRRQDVKDQSVEAAAKTSMKSTINFVTLLYQMF